MAKFCENCGAAMDDCAAVCGQCGTPVGSVGGTAPQTNSGAVNPQSQANNGEPKASNANNSAFIGKIVCAVIALIVVIGIVNVVGKSSSYDSVLKKMVKAIKNDDTDAFINISSQVGQAIHNEQYGEGSYEDMIDNFCQQQLKKSKIGSWYRPTMKVYASLVQAKKNKVGSCFACLYTTQCCL